MAQLFTSSIFDDVEALELCLASNLSLWTGIDSQPIFPSSLMLDFFRSWFRHFPLDVLEANRGVLS